MHIRTIAFAFGVTLAMQVGAIAEEGYAFKFDNASNGAASVLVDGKSVCEIAAGAHCTVTVTPKEHAYTVSLAGGTPVAFSPGNPAMADSCKIATDGVHCVDPSGNATN